MGLIKDIYSETFYKKMSNSLVKVLPNFDQEKFMEAIMPPTFLQMEWKQRMRHTADVLHKFMPSSYGESATLMGPIVDQLKRDGFTEQRLEFIFLPEYIAIYGIDDLENSIKALELLTQYISAEFAVRPFLIRYGDKMLSQMVKWSLHPNFHVRRFASEGSRPRLPWGAAIPALKSDPSALLPLLENLKNDPHEYVRRSVANNLNDITKDNPAVVIELAKRWKGHSKETDAIIKHACRSLLKKGDAAILGFYGLDANNLTVSDFVIETPQIKIGDAVEFAFTLLNTDSIPRYVRLEYTIYYLKQNGSLAGKVFKISEKTYQAGEKVRIKRKQSFRLITTRKFYIGKHQLSIMVNGMEKSVGDFELIA